MRCFEEIVYSIFLDNELSPENRKKILAHLKECKKCQKIVKQMKKENLKIKKSFETGLTLPNLSSTIMDKIVVSESKYFREKPPWSFFIYGIFIITGLLAPYFLSVYLKSTSLFQNFLNFIFTPLSLISHIGTFILRKIIFVNPEELTTMFGQIFSVILLLLILSSYVIKKKKIIYKGGI
mgnify:CR=1 FL=1